MSGGVGSPSRDILGAMHGPRLTTHFTLTN
jgi:hypothetical protein